MTTVALGGRTRPKQTGHTAVAPPTAAAPVSWCVAAAGLPVWWTGDGQGTDTRPCPGVFSWCPDWGTKGSPYLLGPPD